MSTAYYGVVFGTVKGEARYDVYILYVRLILKRLIENRK